MGSPGGSPGSWSPRPRSTACGAAARGWRRAGARAGGAAGRGTGEEGGREEADL